MNEKRQKTVSKFLSLHLRHEPDGLGLTIEPGGWVPINDLLAGARKKGFPIAREELDRVVADSDKQRFAIDELGLRIRANQGHSVEVDLQLAPAEPPAELFHGTGSASVEGILADGLQRRARHHVHLSPDTETATKVGARHGKPVVLVIDAAKMRADGHVFFCSANGVWLVDEVPPQYLRLR
ncbi:MAG TPA: RNA 2'-phosphotransferase [Gemmataceae bacterium]|nr:RNA 2'-phosphotransferase [Gemmataceae bacterium]